MLHTGTDAVTLYTLVTLIALMASYPFPANGHFMVLSEDSIEFLSDNFNEGVPYKLTTKFAPICKHVPANCQPFVFPNDSMILIPSVDEVKLLEFTNISIKTLHELNLTNCFRFVPTGTGNELYALCLKYHQYEVTIVTYKIEYNKDLMPLPSQYDSGYGTHIDLDSPLIVTSDSTGPVVLYIAMVQGDAMLFIMQLKHGGDVHSTQPLPSNCTGPYELKPLYQSYALLKCSNGYVHTYDIYMGEFTKLPVQAITMIEQCANSSSFVMVTSQGNVLLNETTSETLVLVSFFKITINSLQLDTILSFACHWNGFATYFYFTALQDGTIYYLSFPLEHVAKLNTVTEAHQMLKFTTAGSQHISQSNIVGSAWTTELANENNIVQELVFINIRTEASGSHLSNDVVYMLSYEDKPYHSPSPDTKSEPKNSSGLAPSTIGYMVAGCALIVIIALTTFLSFLIFRRHRVLAKRWHFRILGDNRQGTGIDDGTIEMHHLTNGDAAGDHTLNNQNLSTTNQGGSNQTSTDSHLPSATDSNPVTATDSHAQTAMDSHPHTATDSYPLSATDSNPQTPVNSYPQTAANSNPQTAVDFHPPSATDFNSLTATDSHAQTAMDSYPQTAIYHLQTVIDFHTQTSADSYPTDFHPHTATDSHPLSTTNHPQTIMYSHSQTVTDSCPPTAIDSHPQTDMDSHSQIITDSHPQTDMDANDYPASNRFNYLTQSTTFIPSEEESTIQPNHNTRERRVTGSLHGPVVMNEPSGAHDGRSGSDDETSVDL